MLSSLDRTDMQTLLESGVSVVLAKEYHEHQKIYTE